MSVHDACEAWAEGRLPIERALELTGAADVGELLIICYQCDVPRLLLTGPPSLDWHARRAALKQRDAALDAARPHIPGLDGPSDEAGIEAEAVEACRDIAMERAAEADLVVTVRLRADGGLVVSSPGTPPHRIVAVRAKQAGAAGQRVAELVEEALRERERRD